MLGFIEEVLQTFFSNSFFRYSLWAVSGKWLFLVIFHLMKKTLKEHRLYQHLSQQELAEQSRVSLRTIQRIESGASTGSPYVIRQLCESLHIDPHNLILTKLFTDSEISRGAESPQWRDNAEYRYNRRIKYINFSVLSVLCFPFLNLVIPSILYVLFKKMLSGSRDKTAALKILSLQIVWAVATLIVLIAIPVADHYFFNLGDVLEIPLFLWAYLLLVIILVLLTLKTASDINKTKDLLIFVPEIL